VEIDYGAESLNIRTIDPSFAEDLLEFLDRARQG